jgi:hypothetical protein
MFKKNPPQEFKPGIEACTHSPKYLEGWGRRAAWAQEFQASLGNIVKLHLKKKKRLRKARTKKKALELKEQKSIMTVC